MRILLILFFFPLIGNFNPVSTEPVKSAYLKMDKEIYDAKEKIGFYVNHNAKIRVETMSCSCGNEDFYYQVYERGQTPDEETIFNNHRDEGGEKCTCKSEPAVLVPSVIYYIEPINSQGVYFLRIKDTKGNVLISSDFVVR